MPMARHQRSCEMESDRRNRSKAERNEHAHLINPKRSIRAVSWFLGSSLIASSSPRKARQWRVVGHGVAETRQDGSSSFIQQNVRRFALQVYDDLLVLRLLNERRRDKAGMVRDDELASLQNSSASYRHYRKPKEQKPVILVPGKANWNTFTGTWPRSCYPNATSIC